jgi:hypothetical protein
VPKIVGTGAAVLPVESLPSISSRMLRTWISSKASVCR